MGRERGGVGDGGAGKGEEEGGGFRTPNPLFGSTSDAPSNSFPKGRKLFQNDTKLPT